MLCYYKKMERRYQLLNSYEESLKDSFKASPAFLFETMVNLYTCGEKDLAREILQKHDFSELEDKMAFFVIKAYAKSGDRFWLEVAHAQHFEQILFYSFEHLNEGETCHEIGGARDEEVTGFLEGMLGSKFWSGDTWISTCEGDVSLRALLVWGNFKLANSILEADRVCGIQDERLRQDYAVSLALRYSLFREGEEKIDTLWADTLRKNPPQESDVLTALGQTQREKLFLRSDAPFHTILGRFLNGNIDDIIAQALYDFYEHWNKLSPDITLKHLVSAFITEDETYSRIDTHPLIEEGLKVADENLRRVILLASAKNSFYFWKGLSNNPCFERILTKDEIVEIIQLWQEENPLSSSSISPFGFWAGDETGGRAFYNALKWGPQDVEDQLASNFDHLFSFKKKKSILPSFSKSKTDEDDLALDISLGVINLLHGVDGVQRRSMERRSKKM